MEGRMTCGGLHQEILIHHGYEILKSRDFGIHALRFKIWVSRIKGYLVIVIVSDGR